MKSVWVEGTLEKDEVHNILLQRSDEPSPTKIQPMDQKWVIDVNTTCVIGGVGVGGDKISPPSLATAALHSGPRNVTSTAGQDPLAAANVSIITVKQATAQGVGAAFLSLTTAW